jgi:hypothetical protein
VNQVWSGPLWPQAIGWLRLLVAASALSGNTPDTTQAGCTPIIGQSRRHPVKEQLVNMHAV